MFGWPKLTTIGFLLLSCAKATGGKSPVKNREAAMSKLSQEWWGDRLYIVLLLWFGPTHAVDAPVPVASAI